MVLSPEELSWISHDGQACPVGEDARPAIRFRNGAQLAGGFLRAAELMSFWTWTDPPSGYDVVAYASETQR